MPKPAQGPKFVLSNVQDWRQKLIEHKFTQRCLLVAVVLGVGLIMGDGVLTPAISVVSAIEGLQTGIPSITRGASACIACERGTAKYLSEQWSSTHVEWGRLCSSTEPD